MLLKPMAIIIPQLFSPHHLLLYFFGFPGRCVSDACFFRSISSPINVLHFAQDFGRSPKTFSSNGIQVLILRIASSSTYVLLILHHMPFVQNNMNDNASSSPIATVKGPVAAALPISNKFVPSHGVRTNSSHGIRGNSSQGHGHTRNQNQNQIRKSDHSAMKKSQEGGIDAWSSSVHSEEEHAQMELSLSFQYGGGGLSQFQSGPPPPLHSSPPSLSN
jgi:hypothetical protein